MASSRSERSADSSQVRQIPQSRIDKNVSSIYGLSSEIEKTRKVLALTNSKYEKITGNDPVARADRGMLILLRTKLQKDLTSME